MKSYLIFTSSILWGAIATAQPNIDQVMEGFDDPAPVTTAPVDEVLQGFDEPAVAPAVSATAKEKEQAWRLSGATTLAASYNYAHEAPPPGATDYRGLSRLRGKLNLELDGNLAANWRARATGYGLYDGAYALNGRDHYPDELLDSMEREVELGEAFVQGRVSRALDLKLGRQIVVWGKSDSLRVTDVINPLDNREPGMVDIEDLRLPLAMARADGYVGAWGLTALAIPEVRFNKNPAYGSEFYPYPIPMPHEVIPGDGGGNTEYALAANGLFSGWDLSLYWAQLYDDTPHAVIAGTAPQLQHSRLTMNGAAANLALGNWLLKTELARFSGVGYSGVAREYTRNELLLGVDYSGFSDTTLSLEVVSRRIADHDAALQLSGVVAEEWQSALRYQGDFFHARLHLIALASAFGKQLDAGGFSRLSAAYDLADALTVSGGVVRYEGGSKFPFAAVADNDRLFAEVKYSF